MKRVGIARFLVFLKSRKGSGVSWASRTLRKPDRVKQAYKNENLIEREALSPLIKP